MKFIHIADVHLGLVSDPGRSWSRTWTEARLSVFRDVLDLCNQEQTDLLLIAGDLFQKVPDRSALREVNRLFSTLQKTYVVLIAGNHDPVTEASPYYGFEWCKRVFFLKKSSFSSVYFPNLDTEICGFSYDRAEIPEARCDAVRPGKRGKYQILLAHGGDDRHVPLRLQHLSEAGFDYIALGHLHQPQLWPERRMAYSGSLMPTDCTDIGKRGYVRGEITPQGTVLSFVPFSPHEYITLKLNLTPEITQTAIEEQLKKRCAETPGTVYRLILDGRYRPDSPPDPERLLLCGDIVSIEDHSMPDYPLAQLAREHAGDVIGMYLASFDLDHMDEVETKALYYGLDALLKGTHI